MLVTFSCPAYSDITLFGDIATHMLKLMGHSGNVPGAFLAEDVPAALARLQTKIDLDEPEPQLKSSSAKDDSDEPSVSLRHRALPLVELLKAAEKADCHVMWDKQ